MGFRSNRPISYLDPAIAISCPISCVSNLHFGPFCYFSFHKRAALVIFLSSFQSTFVQFCDIWLLTVTSLIFRSEFAQYISNYMICIKGNEDGPGGQTQLT